MKAELFLSPLWKQKLKAYFDTEKSSRLASAITDTLWLLAWNTVIASKLWAIRGLPGILESSHRTESWIMKFFSERRTVTTAFTKWKTKVQKYVNCLRVYVNTQADNFISVKQLTSTYWRTGKEVKQKRELHSVPKMVVDPCRGIL